MNERRLSSLGEDSIRRELHPSGSICREGEQATAAPY